jgi:thiamine pyrophosphokinase
VGSRRHNTGVCAHAFTSYIQYDLVLLGGLSGRLDQTVHVLSLLHKLRKTRERIFAFTDDNVGWVLDEVSRKGREPLDRTSPNPPLSVSQGEHEIAVDQSVFGPTCGLLPVGIATTTLTTRGLRWDVGEYSFS